MTIRDYLNRTAVINTKLLEQGVNPAELYIDDYDEVSHLLNFALSKAERHYLNIHDAIVTYVDVDGTIEFENVYTGEKFEHERF